MVSIVKFAKASLPAILSCTCMYIFNKKFGNNYNSSATERVTVPSKYTEMFDETLQTKIELSTDALSEYALVVKNTIKTDKDIDEFQDCLEKTFNSADNSMPHFNNIRFLKYTCTIFNPKRFANSQEAKKLYNLIKKIYFELSGLKMIDKRVSLAAFRSFLYIAFDNKVDLFPIEMIEKMREKKTNSLNLSP